MLTINMIVLLRQQGLLPVVILMELCKTTNTFLEQRNWPYLSKIIDTGRHQSVRFTAVMKTSAGHSSTRRS